MRKYLIISFFVSSLLAMAQPPKRFYTKFGGNGDDIGYSVKVTLDKQYIITGLTLGVGGVGSDVLLAKMDTMGQLIWLKQLGGFNDDIGKSVVQLIDSGYVVAGYTNSFGAGGYDAYLVKTDKNGNVVWQRTFGGEDWDFANDLVVTSNGNLALVGSTSSFGKGKKDGMVLLYDYSGNLLSQKFYGGSENEELKAIIRTNDNFLTSVGYTQSYADSLGDHYILKLDLNGDTLLTRKFGNPGKSYLNDLVQFPNGNYVLAGAETYTDLPFTQSYRAYINPTLNQIVWQGNSFTHNDNESWISVTKSVQGSSVTSTLRDFYKNGFKVQGNIFSNKWDDYYPLIVNDFGGVEDEHLWSHEATNDGGFICVGSTRSFGSVGEDVFVIKLDSGLVNYSSIVGFKNEERLVYSVPVIKQNETGIQIVFDQNRIPSSVEVVCMDGRLLQKLNNLGTVVDINRQVLNCSLVILKFIYSDGSCVSIKIPIL